METAEATESEGVKRVRRRLLECRTDGGELAAHTGADASDAGDDHDADAAGNDGVFDRRSPDVITQKSCKQRAHEKLLSDARGFFSRAVAIFQQN